MAFVTRSDLVAVGLRRSLLEQADLHKSCARQAQPARPVVFLSHSHIDAGLVRMAAALLDSEGADVYIDWLDDGLPDQTNGNTARLLRGKIETSSRFIVLSSENARNSKWVPWELGFADGVKPPAHIAILYVAESKAEYKGSEYMSVYGRIEYADDGRLAVFPPEQNKGMYLRDWLHD